MDRGDGGAALVMELVEGTTLADRIAMGPIPVRRRCPIALQIVDAFEAAHESGIVHRDLKPANIKVRPDGVVKVLDFGLAKALDPGVHRAWRRSADDVDADRGWRRDGTAAYMSPEQARGRPVDQRTDIWAFGCVLYEMLTGRRAFRAEDAAEHTRARARGRREYERAAVGRLAGGAPHDRALPAKRSRGRVCGISVTCGWRSRVSSSPRRPSRPRWRRAVVWCCDACVALLLAVAYFIVQMRRAPSSPASPPAVSRLSITTPATAPLASLGGLDLAISPDGRRIVLLCANPRQADRVELYVRELDGLDARPIAGTEAPGTGAWQHEPVFLGRRQVGRSVRCRTWHRRRRRSTAGRPSRYSTRRCRRFVGASWAADNTLIYSSGLRLQRVSAAGGGTPGAADAGRRRGDWSPAPSPCQGAERCCFTSSEAARNRIAVLNLDTKQEKTLVDGASNMYYLDTGHLVFVRGDTLMAVPFNALRTRSHR